MLVRYPCRSLSPLDAADGSSVTLLLMHRRLALLVALAFTAAACAGEPAPSPSAGVSVSVRAWGDRYDASGLSSVFSVPFLGKQLVAYERIPEYDESGALISAGDASVLLSDGTESGTVSLLDGSLVPNSDGLLNAVELDGVGYFIASPTIVAGENGAVALYATDGSAAGTREIDRLDAAVEDGGVSTWLVGIGSGASATLCLVAGVNSDSAGPQIDCYRPNEAMRKVELGATGLSVYDGLTIARAGDRFYLTAGGSLTYPSERPTTLLSVTATAKADDLAIEREQFPGTMRSMIRLGDGEAALLVNQVALSEALDDLRFDLRRLDADGTVTMLISAPAEEFGHPAWGASFAAELSADASTIYLSSYDNTTAESTSWLYAFTRGEPPRVLSTGLFAESPVYTLYRAPDGRIAGLDSGTFSWLGADGLTLAASTPADRYFTSPLFLEDGSVYLHTYTVLPELESEIDPWYYLPAGGGEPIVFTTGSDFTTSAVTRSSALSGRAGVYLVEFRAPQFEVAGEEFVETGEYASRLYRFVDGVPTELSIEQASPEGAERLFYSLYQLGDGVLLQTLLVRGPTGSDQSYEFFELLP